MFCFKKSLAFTLTFFLQHSRRFNQIGSAMRWHWCNVLPRTGILENSSWKVLDFICLPKLLLTTLAKIPLYLYPFLHTTNDSRPFEYLRLTSLGVLGALVKTDEKDVRRLWFNSILYFQVVKFLLSTEIIPLCLRIMEQGTELSRTVATFILQVFDKLNFNIRYSNLWIKTRWILKFFRRFSWMILDLPMSAKHTNDFLM